MPLVWNRQEATQRGDREDDRNRVKEALKPPTLPPCWFRPLKSGGLGCSHVSSFLKAALKTRPAAEETPGRLNAAGHAHFPVTTWCNGSQPKYSLGAARDPAVSPLEQCGTIKVSTVFVTPGGAGGAGSGAGNSPLKPSVQSLQTQNSGLNS